MVRGVLDTLQTHTSSVVLPDETTIQVNLHKVEDLVVPVTEIIAKARAIANPFAFEAIYGSKSQGGEHI